MAPASFLRRLSCKPKKNAEPPALSDLGSDEKFQDEITKALNEYHTHCVEPVAILPPDVDKLYSSIKAKIEQKLKPFGASLVVYGSFAEGNAIKDLPIDILVLCTTDIEAKPAKHNGYFTIELDSDFPFEDASQIDEETDAKSIEAKLSALSLKGNVESDKLHERLSIWMSAIAAQMNQELSDEVAEQNKASNADSQTGEAQSAAADESDKLVDKGAKSHEVTRVFDVEFDKDANRVVLKIQRIDNAVMQLRFGFMSSKGTDAPLYLGRTWDDSPRKKKALKAAFSRDRPNETWRRCYLIKEITTVQMWSVAEKKLYQCLHQLRNENKELHKLLNSYAVKICYFHVLKDNAGFDEQRMGEIFLKFWDKMYHAIFSRSLPDFFNESINLFDSFSTSKMQTLAVEYIKPIHDDPKHLKELLATA